jgi:hypothetical protein
VEGFEPVEHLIEVNDYEVDLRENSADYAKLRDLRNLTWTKRKWAPSGAWIYEGEHGAGRARGNAERPPDEQALLNLGINPGTELQYDEQGWDADACTICGVALEESEDPVNGEAWLNGDTWVCDECYRLFVDPEAVFAGKFPPREENRRTFDADSELSGT